MKPSKRSVAAVGSGFIIIVLIFSYYYFSIARPIRRGPAGPRVTRSAFERVWSDRPVVLVAIGDSVTAGFGASPGRSYVDLLVNGDPAEIRDISLKRVFPHINTLKLAVSGSTSIDHLKNQIARIPAFSAGTFGLVVMTTGGNDVIHNYGRTPPREGAMYGATLEQANPWIKSFENRLESMIIQICDRFPGGCSIFVGNIYDPTDGIGDAPHAGLPDWPDGLKVIGAYNRVIHEAADKHSGKVHVVPIHNAFLGHGIHCAQFWRSYYHADDPNYWYYHNLEDPNDSGYDAIRRLFLIETAKAFASWNTTNKQ